MNVSLWQHQQTLMIKKILFLFLFSSASLVAQKKYTILYGAISDTLGFVKNAHVLNLGNKKGTFSNNIGAFKIPVRLGDSLQVSSVQYKTKLFYISKHSLKKGYLQVTLKAKTILLDEIIVKNINLSKVLTIDSKNAPKDKKAAQIRSLLTFTDEELTGPMTLDAMNKMKPNEVQTMPNSFEGVGASAFIPFKDSERLWATRRKLAKKAAFPKKILSELGKKFFFTDLKIPKNKFYHFIEYCIPLDVEKLYENRNILELIKIFQKESISYLKIVKK